MKTLSRLLKATVLLALVSACGPKDSGGQPGSGSPDLFRRDGTATTGGGNGINGKVTEMYTKNIESLPEYRRYVVPLLRKLSQHNMDVFVVYLKWAAKNKVWYFVPKKLESIPKEQIAMTFISTDQLALHSEKEIFIDEPAYLEQDGKTRAWLLIHEMVMGAKLLMKQLPEVQCQALSDIHLPSGCKNRELMGLASANPQLKSNPQPRILNGADHESVRSMTARLLDPKQDLGREHLEALRQQYDFPFPWDHLLSSVDAKQWFAALSRTLLSKTAFKALPGFTNVEERSCEISPLSTYYWDRPRGFKIDIPPGFMKPLEPTAPLNQEPADGKGIEVDLNLAHFPNIPLEARGVPHPFDRDGGIVDLVEFEPDALYAKVERAPSLYRQFRLQFYLTRDEKPSVIEIRFIPVQFRSELEYSNGFAIQARESIVIKGIKPAICRAIN